MTSAPGEGEITIPELLRAARGCYAQAIAGQLSAEGFDDVPRNGAFVLGGMASQCSSAASVIEGLDITKQAASQLIDTLVLRGYLTREINPDDRRRMIIAPTARGRAAAAAIRTAIASVDAELALMLSPVERAGLWAGLRALAAIKDRMRPSG